jgi:DNA-binding response OmpR family regulator
VRRILFLTQRSPEDVLPAALSADADVKVEPPAADVLTRLPDLAPELLVADAVDDPDRVHALLAVLASAGRSLPVVAVVELNDLSRLAWDQVADDFVLPDATDEEVDLRLAFLHARRGEEGDAVVRLGPVSVNTDSYQVSAGARRLDLTFKEFELLRYLAERPGRVFSRATLLQEVWGYDFFGGTRTVDVHVRRLRAKLGPEHEHLIETVRGVGYRAADTSP